MPGTIDRAWVSTLQASRLALSEPIVMCSTHLTLLTVFFSQKLSNANSQLEKNSARMRTRNEQVARNDKAVGALQAQLMEKEDKLRAFDDYKKMVELSLSSLSNERDQARAIKSKLEEKYKAQLELLKVVTQVSARFRFTNNMLIATVGKRPVQSRRREVPNRSKEVPGGGEEA